MRIFRIGTTGITHSTMDQNGDTDGRVGVRICTRVYELLIAYL